MKKLAFWSDISVDVSDFFQEDHGDVRDWAVAGADVPTRTTYLNQLLQHPQQLAAAGATPRPPPPRISPAPRLEVRRLHVTVRVADGAGPTRRDGTLALTARPRVVEDCYTAHIRSLRVAGHVWDRASPAKRYCVR